MLSFTSGGVPSVDYHNVPDTELYHLVQVAKVVIKLHFSPCSYHVTSVMILCIFQMSSSTLAFHGMVSASTDSLGRNLN